MPQPQDHSQATMAPLLRKEDGEIDWTRRAADLVNQVRGMSPWPGAFTFAGGEQWKIWRAARDADHPASQPPGTVLQASPKGITVTTGEGALLIIELQPPNRRRMSAAEYLAGHSIKPGLGLGKKTC